MTAGLTFLPLPAGPFEIVAADPAWNFKSNSLGRPGRNPRRHYRCLSLAEIAAIPVREVVADNAALFLWITTPFLAIGAHLPIMRAWGFKPSGFAFTWVKTRRALHDAPKFWLSDRDFHFGSGLTTRKNVEICLLGKRRRSLRVDAGVRELIVAPVREHSRKPDEFFARVERYAGERSRLELFSRTERPGWTSWGDEAGTIPLGAPAGPTPTLLEAAE